jgi:SAM-dependent methyltransferase
VTSSEGEPALMPESHLASYIIKGGEEGRARLAVIGRVLEPSTRSLFDRFEPLRGRLVVDAGCGGGDVTMELARRAGPEGRAIGFDLDEVKLALARDEAARLGLKNIEFRVGSVLERWPVERAALIYIRFVLTHLPNPLQMLERAREALEPGGVIVTQDIDYDGEFCDPPCRAFDGYRELYVAAAQRRGVDPFIGRKLVRLLDQAGFSQVDSTLVQPYGRDGELKHVCWLTLAAITDAVVDAGLARREDVMSTIAELRAFAERSDTLIAVPRLFQVWGRKR